MRNILHNSAVKVSGMGGQNRTDEYGYGRIDANLALVLTRGYGHINKNISFSHDVQLSGDLIVDEGVTLTIEPGVTVTLSSGAEMDVYGTLIAEGEAGDEIVFASQSSSNNHIVKFYNSTSSASNLEYCKFQNAQYGIYIDDSDISVSNCEITDCIWGIYNNYATTTISDNDITSICGIYNYWSNGDIINNELNCSGYNIYNYHSSPDINGNEIYGTGYGIRCFSYSSPQLGSYYEPGYNYVHDSEHIGLYASASSNPFLGVHNCHGSGHNSFVNNEDAQIKADANCSILAEDNWWGSSSPPSGWFIGDVDYIPYLTSPPSMPENIQQSPEEEVFDMAFKNNSELSNGLSAMSFYDKDWNLRKKTRFAHALIYNGEPDSAIIICKNIIAQYPDSSLAFFALDLVWQANRLIDKERGSGLNDFAGYLEFISNQKTTKLIYGSAELLLAGFEREDGLARIDAVFNKYRLTYLAEEALFQKFMFYFNESEDSLMARSVVNQMDKLFPESALTSEAHQLFGDFVGGWSELSSTQETANILETADSGETNGMIPDKYELIGVYPNPFNPSTSIKYAIPQLSQIEVDIYNMLGQKVKGFRIVAQQPGIHDLVWDGTNDANVRVSSGLYIIQFKATSLEDQTEIFEKSVKVTLLK